MAPHEVLPAHENSPTASEAVPAAAGAAAPSTIPAPAPTAANPIKSGHYQYPPKFQFEDHAFDDVPPIKAIVIGAGIAGINAGILLPAKVPGLELVIYDKNADVGGTWFENVYPGVRCDIPAHVYQSTFSPNIAWSEHYAEGAEIQRYWRDVSLKYDVYKYLRLRHQVRRAWWDEHPVARWNVEVQNLDTGEIFTDSANVLVTAVGRFNAWKLPDYPGIETFGGHLRHASNWDPAFRPEGKRVAVIGNGASGLQVVPQLAKAAAHLDHYARNPTWIARSFGGEDRKLIPFTSDELSSFQDPSKYYAFRKALESRFFSRFGSIFRNSPANARLREEIIATTKERLKDSPSLLADGSIFPSFSPGCRRLTPGPGYLEALAQPHVDYVRTPIARFTKSGIVTVDGVEREVDAVICATGADTSYAPPFSVVARGVDLREAWRPDGSIGFPKTYLGIAVPRFPNFFVVGGPEATGASGTVPHSLENQVVYIAQVLRKLSTQGLTSLVPSDVATQDFVDYAASFWPRTVLTEDCSSWYKGGVRDGHIHGLFPGSSTLLTKVRRSVRWEDFEYTYRSASGNRFAYFGNGWTKDEIVLNTEGEKEGGDEKESERGVIDLTPYLRKPEEIDLRSYHEEWFTA